MTENGWAAHPSKHTAKATTPVTGQPTRSTPRANQRDLSDRRVRRLDQPGVRAGCPGPGPATRVHRATPRTSRRTRRAPTIALGTRITWQQSGESGEGMVDVLLASPGSPRYAGACTEFGPCRDADSPGFGHYLISGDPADGTGLRSHRDAGRRRDCRRAGRPALRQQRADPDPGSAARRSTRC